MRNDVKTYCKLNNFEFGILNFEFDFVALWADFAHAYVGAKAIN